MNPKRKIVGPVLAVAAVGIALAVSIFLHRFIEPPPPIAFHATQSASVRIQAAGFHCAADNPHGRIDNGFLVSPDAITWQDVNAIRKGVFVADDWKGKAWIAKSAANSTIDAVVPDGAGVRFWGGVVAFGDERLLVEIECELRK